MKIRLIPVWFAFGLLSGFANPPADTQHRLDEWAGNQPGGASVAWVDQDGEVFFTTGHFNANSSPAITPDTFFEIGSITKVFTALLLAESERQHKVSLLDPVSRYLLPSADPAQESLQKITLLSLATHQSGLPRLPANLSGGRASSLDPYADYNRNDLLDAFRLHARKAEVGRSILYSNFGFAVLGEAVASAWGVSYDAALRDHLLTPLGMKQSRLGLLGTPSPEGLATGLSGGGPVPDWKFQAFAPAGALRSSAREMALFMKAALELEPSPLHEAFEATFAVRAPHPDTGGDIGLAWMLFKRGSDSFAWHNGATAGHRSVIVLDRTQKRGVLILSNLSKPPESLAFPLLGTPLPAPNTRIENAAEYVGLYPLSPAFSLRITEKDGSLLVQGTGQGQLSLRPTAVDRFAAIGVAAEIEFERDANGGVTGLTLHQNGAQTKGPRQALPPPPTETSLPATVLAEYPGEYPASYAYVFRITLEEGTLFIQAAGQPKLPLTASGKDEFFSKSIDLRISFTRNEGGKVNGFILRQGGADVKANRMMN